MVRASGLEYILTRDVLGGLDVLPRKRVLGAVLEAVHSSNGLAARAMQAEIEDVELTVFPEAHALRPDARTHQARIEVQPDARYLSPSVYMLVEAIRIKTSSFQPEQLACNLLVLLRDCGKRVPVLLLSLGRPPHTAR